MHIQAVEIRNFRKLASVRLDFAKQTTLLVGANNSGKTSALMALRSFLKKGISAFSKNDLTLSLGETSTKLAETGQRILPQPLPEPGPLCCLASTSGCTSRITKYTVSAHSFLPLMRRIIIPSAFRRALPAYGNEVIFMLHASAIASVVTIMDLTGAARFVYARFYAPFDAFLFVAAIYLCLTFTILYFFRYLEKKLLAHLQPQNS